ncbi:MAG: DUF354 domain-containing protein [archaeon]
MRILVDMVHPADVNFYKKALYSLKKDGHEILITVLDRGRLIDFVREEYPDFIIFPLGKHMSGKFGKILGIIEREWAFYRFFMWHRFERVTSFGFYPAIAASFFKIKSITFHDDFEYKLNFKLCKMFATKFVIPDSIPVFGKNIVKYHGFKELSYLYNFKPKKAVLKEYGVKENKYIFVRDIAKISLNYKDMEEADFSEVFKMLKKKKIDILYFPEDASKAAKYAKYVKELKAPIKDFHSLLYYAAFCLSSGDTVAREAALLGTPVIYTGNRKMAVNSELVAINAIIETEDSATIAEKAEIILKKKMKATLRKKITAKKKSWDDTSDVIVREILNG